MSWLGFEPSTSSKGVRLRLLPLNQRALLFAVREALNVFELSNKDRA
jgi:hypothetical protein